MTILKLSMSPYITCLMLVYPNQCLRTKNIRDLVSPKLNRSSPSTTSAKCFLACLVDDNLLEDADGLPQIFTLKLTSNKTQLIGYLNNDSSSTTILSLNQSLQKHFKNQQNDFIHLISVKLAIKPTEFVSSRSGDSSVGILFTIEDKPKVLTPPHQQQIFELISQQELQTLFDNPFGLKQQDNFFEQSTQEPGLAYQEPDF